METDESNVIILGVDISIECRELRESQWTQRVKIRFVENSFAFLALFNRESGAISFILSRFDDEKG